MDVRGEREKWKFRWGMDTSALTENGWWMCPVKFRTFRYKFLPIFQIHTLTPSFDVWLTFLKVCKSCKCIGKPFSVHFLHTQKHSWDNVHFGCLSSVCVLFFQNSWCVPAHCTPNQCLMSSIQNEWKFLFFCVLRIGITVKKVLKSSKKVLKSSKKVLKSSKKFWKHTKNRRRLFLRLYVDTKCVFWRLKTIC